MLYLKVVWGWMWFEGVHAEEKYHVKNYKMPFSDAQVMHPAVVKQCGNR